MRSFLPYEVVTVVLLCMGLAFLVSRSERATAPATPSGIVLSDDQKSAAMESLSATSATSTASSQEKLRILHSLNIK
jgi:hypothetical protein